MERTRRGGTVLAFLIGGVVGAGIALLYAPNSGAQTRKKMKDGLGDATDWTRDKYDDARHTVADTTDKVRQIVDEKKEDLKAAVDAGKEAFLRGKERLLREIS
ncbi:MAG: YtxH domain-containing protein [Deltaproteobacteria bacterium]